MSQETVYLMPFSHLDLYWAGSEEDCLSRGNRIISGAMQLAKLHSEFRFFLELAVFVDYFARTHPEKLDDLKALVKSGKIEIGAEWSGLHQCVNSGEALVRNTLYAWKFIYNTFGVEPKVIHPGDIPGFTPQHPQIMSKTGIPYTFFTRAGPSDKNLLYWRGLDGTRVLVWNAKMYSLLFERGFHEDAEAAKEKGLEDEIVKIRQLSNAPVLVHWGFDLVVPSEQLIHNIEKWNKISSFKMEMVTPQEYFSIAKQTLQIPEATGQIPSYWPYYEPCYIDMTSLDIPALQTILSAEKFSAIAFFLRHLSSYPSERFEVIWKNLLKSLDHNRDACGEVEGDARMKEYKQRAIYEAGEILRQALQAIAEKVKACDHGEDALPIVVFNSMSWAHTGVVEARTTFHGKYSAFRVSPYNNIALFDDDGKEIPFQRFELLAGPALNVAFSFIAKDVPPIGYKTYYMIPVPKESSFERTCVFEDGVLENSFYRITVDPIDGKIDIFDKDIQSKLAEGTEIVGVEETEDANAHRDKVTGKVFRNNAQEIRLMENGPVRATLLIKGRILESIIVQEITIYKDLKRIDIKDHIEWYPRTRIRIQRVFPIKIENSKTTYGVPYGACMATTLMPNSGPEHATPAEMDLDRWKKMREVQEWIAVWNDNICVTISTGPRSYEIDEAILRANLIRGVKGRATILRTGNPYQKWVATQKAKDGGVNVPPDLRPVSSVHPPTGHYIFRFSVESRKGSWKEARSFLRGWEFCNPLIPIGVGDALTDKTLPPTKSFFKLNGENLILTTLKKAESKDAVIARFFETTGEVGRAEIDTAFNIRRIEETDLLERETQLLDGSSFTVAPFEIKTIEIDIDDRKSENG